MKQSTFGSINLSDFAHGAFLAFIGAFFTAVYQQTQAGLHLPTVGDIKADLGIAVLAILGYIIKAVGTNSDGGLMKKEDEPKFPYSNPKQ